MTIILFDVDQTLLYSGGAGSLAMKRAFEQLYGVEDGFARVEFSGRTDWGILLDAMQQHGLLEVRGSKFEVRAPVRDPRPTTRDPHANGDDSMFRAEMARFQETYYSLLPETLKEKSAQGRVMPGVPELLDVLAGRDDVAIGLATGNFRKAAFIKLDHFGLDGYLSDGGFGDDAEERGEVVRLAIERVGHSPFPLREGGQGVRSEKASSFPPLAIRSDPAGVRSAAADEHGQTSEGGQGVRFVWVIGDTPLDIAAAHANGAKALAVATGTKSVDELLEAKADTAIDDLSDTEAVVRLLTA